MFEESCVFSEFASETIETTGMSTRCTCSACANRRMLWAYFTPGDEEFQALAHSGIYRWERNASCQSYDA